MASNLDHYVGQCRRSYAPGLTCIGSIHEVWHGLDNEGSISSWAYAEDKSIPLSIESQMKDSTRILLTGELT